MGTIVGHSNDTPRHSQELITRVQQPSHGIARVVLAILVVLAISAASYQGYRWLSDPQALPIRYVDLKGRLQYVDQARLQEYVQAEVSGGFFNLDLQKIKASLEALPWVYEVSLRRIWPDRLLIRVIEQQPIAFWGDDGLLNQYGEVFHPDLRGLDLALPYFYGEEAQREAMIEYFVSADKLLHPLGMDLVSLKMDRRNELRLLLSNGIELAVGRADQNKRLRGFAQVYAESIAPFIDRIESVDLRYPNGFAVKWKEGMQQQPHQATQKGKG